MKKEYPDKFHTGKNSDHRTILVETMMTAIRYWYQTTGKTKVDLARESGIWHVSVDRNGSWSTRTLDRYLNIHRLPEFPRYHNVLQTAYYTLQHCPDLASEMKRLLMENTRKLEILVSRQ